MGMPTDWWIYAGIALAVVVGVALVVARAMRTRAEPEIEYIETRPVQSPAALVDAPPRATAPITAAEAPPPPQPAPPPPELAPPPPPPEPAPGLSAAQLDLVWQNFDGTPAATEMFLGRTPVLGGWGICSAQSIPVSAGEVLVVEFAVRAASAPTNGGAINAFAGPVFFGADGAVVQWWPQLGQLPADGGMLSGEIEVAAPQGAVIARLGAHGPYALDASVVAADCLVAFEAIHLRKRV